jgi:DNA-binding CsgD family transcriptional regulator
MKKGRISKEEERIIARLVDSLTVEDIAKQLDRDVESVDAFIKRKLRVGLTNEEAAAFSLESRPYWTELTSQFTGDELELFKYHWSRIIAQFKDDVFPTEELQVVDVIKLEILMNRCLKSNKDNLNEMSLIEKMIRDERALDKDQRDQDYLMNLERQMASLRASQESLNRDYRELQSKKASILREMKGTREQRIKRLEDSKQSFTAWIASLMQDPETLKRYGIEMEKMRLAMVKEKERLGAYHKYEDGTVDQPFLTPDTVQE